MLFRSFRYGRADAYAQQRVPRRRRALNNVQAASSSSSPCRLSPAQFLPRPPLLPLVALHAAHRSLLLVSTRDESAVLALDCAVLAPPPSCVRSFLARFHLFPPCVLGPNLHPRTPTSTSRLTSLRPLNSISTKHEATASRPLSLLGCASRRRFAD